MIDASPVAKMMRARAMTTGIRPKMSAIVPTTTIGSRLPIEMSMFRMPKTRPRTFSSISSWSSVWAGMATNA